MKSKEKSGYVLTRDVATGGQRTRRNTSTLVDFCASRRIPAQVRLDGNGSEEISWILQADHSISCDSAEYNGFWYAYASFMVLACADETNSSHLPSTRVEEANDLPSTRVN